MKRQTIGVLGAGSWGTAIAIHLAKQNHTVFLWGRDTDLINQMLYEGCNPRYLPHNHFPKSLTPSSDLSWISEACDLILISVPSHAFVQLIDKLSPPKTGISWLTKGLNPLNHTLLSQYIFNKWGEDYPINIISGPSFASEVANGLPTLLTLAGNNGAYQKTMRHLLHANNLRVYLSKDFIGVQIAGAVKNVLAIACGVSDGLSFGSNARAALITRGLNEMTKLGVALGASFQTFMGLAGVGDLVLTCTDDQSRNRRFGLCLGQGKTVTQALAEIGQVVEGKDNATQICSLAKQHHLEMPICQTVNAILKGILTPKEAVVALMNRPSKDESA